MTDRIGLGIYSRISRYRSHDVPIEPAFGTERVDSLSKRFGGSEHWDGDPKPFGEILIARLKQFICLIERKCGVWSDLPAEFAMCLKRSFAAIPRSVDSGCLKLWQKIR